LRARSASFPLPQTGIDPSEVVDPVILTGIEEAHDAASDRVPRPDAIGFEVVALGTSEPEVLVLGAAPRDSGKRWSNSIGSPTIASLQRQYPQR
jgi:hypothetical protein